jgi:ADP-ribose pyrophosphatase
MRLFFYGTLRDEDVLAYVAGQGGARLALRSARAPGWQAVYARGKPYPVLVRAPGRAAPGIVTEVADTKVLRRLKAFEVRYRLVQIAVQSDEWTDTAWVFLPGRRLRAGMIPFALDTWRRRFKTAFLRRIRRRF